MVKLTSILSWNGYHNIPKKYIFRKMFKGVVYENNHYITPPVVYNYTKDWIYSENAPWTSAAEDENDPRFSKKRQIYVPPLKEWFFYRGDKVQIVAGKDAGKQGIVNGIIRQRNWIFVQGLNCKLTSLNYSKNASEITFQQKEQPLVVNRDVKLIDPSDLKPCDVVYRFTESGEKVRVSKRTGQILPIPPDAEATIDYVKKSAYKSGLKDTEASQTSLKTFKPKYKSVEQDLMEEYGIQETRERAPTYVY